jgi:hypothetical protein
MHVSAGWQATDELRVKTVKYFKGLMRVTEGFTDKQKKSLQRPTAASARVGSGASVYAGSGGSTAAAQAPSVSTGSSAKDFYGEGLV